MLLLTIIMKINNLLYFPSVLILKMINEVCYTTLERQRYLSTRVRVKTTITQRICDGRTI